MRPRPKKPVTTPKTRAPRASVRVQVRVAIRAHLTHQITHEKAHGWVRNLSITGAFVETETLFPVDAEVELDTLVRDGDRPVHLKWVGWVAHHRNNGMGLQFDDLDPKTEAVLNRIIEEAMAASGQG